MAGQGETDAVGSGGSRPVRSSAFFPLEQVDRCRPQPRAEPTLNRHGQPQTHPQSQVDRFSGLYMTVGLFVAVMPVGLTGEPRSNPTLGDMRSMTDI